jgi:hypothetical protein
MVIYNNIRRENNFIGARKRAQSSFGGVGRANKNPSNLVQRSEPAISVVPLRACVC